MRLLKCEVLSMSVLAVPLCLEFGFVEASLPIMTTKNIVMKPLKGRLKSVSFFRPLVEINFLGR